MKVAFVVCLALLAFAAAAKSEGDNALRNDPYMDRVVREALDLGETSLIETALTPSSSGIFMPLEDAKDLKNSLLSLSENILGSPASSSATPVNADLPVAAPLTLEKPSLLESKSFSEMLSSNEDAVAAEMAVINKKKAQLLKDRQEEAKLLSQVDEMATDVVQAESFLEEKPLADPVKSFLDLASEAEHVDSEQPAAVPAAEESEEAAAFVELESAVVPATEASLAESLAKGEEVSAEAEALEPTFTEHLESESEGEQDAAARSFLMTNEELSAQLDDLAKTKQ